MLAIASALPAAYYANQELQQVERALHTQMIERYSLWETEPLYRGTPREWTRFAAWLLDADQLMERVRMKHGALADPIEQDFRRDRVFAMGKVVAIYLSGWGIPLALLYGAGAFFSRRPPQP